MAIPKNKEELIEAIKDNYSKLKKDLETVPVDLTRIHTMDGHAKGTQMSVSNLVSYLIGWGELVLKWHQKKEDKVHIDFPETGFKWNELGPLAQKFYADYDHLDYTALLTRFDEVVNQLIIIIENTSNTDLYGKLWYNQWTQGRMIQLNTSSPYKNARSRVRKWKKLMNN